MAEDAVANWKGWEPLESRKDITRAPEVSVLVPVYNVERYLAQCLDSLLAQTFDDFEVICINDGSTDGSRQIIQSYLDDDQRFCVIDKANSGYGDSMNRGLALARGRFVGILESDDAYEPRALELLHDAIVSNKADVAKADFYLYWSEGEERLEPYGIIPASLSGKTVYPVREGKEIFAAKPSIWSALYRRSFLEGEGIDFLPTPGASYQDASFNFKVWSCAKRASFLDERVLRYRQDNESSSVNSPSKAYCVMDEYAEMENWLHRHPELADDLAPVLARMRLNSYLWNYDRLSPDLRKPFLDRARVEVARDRELGYLDPGEIGPVKRAVADALVDHPDRLAASRKNGAPEGGVMGTLKECLALGGPGLVARIALSKLGARRG